MKRILLVKMSSLGDIVHALAGVNDAAAHGYRFDWVAEPAFAEIPALHPAVDNVIPLPWRKWRRNLSQHRGDFANFVRDLRQREYDLIIDSQGLIKSAAVARIAAGPGKTPVAGFNFTSAREPWAAFSYARRCAVPWRQHAIDRQRALFAAVLNYPQPDSEFAFRPQASAQAGAEDPVPDKAVMLFHGTTWPSKHWPDQMWEGLIQLALEQGYTPLVAWASEDEQRRADRFGQVGATVLPRMDIGRLIQVVVRCRAVISIDSGLGHLGASLGVPTLGLYGPTDALLTGTIGPRVYHLQGQAPCMPCMRRECDRYNGPAQGWQGQPVVPACFAAMPPDQVWHAVCELMAETS